MSEELRRLARSLERATEDLASARVLVDTALRQIQGQSEEYLIETPENETVMCGWVSPSDVAAASIRPPRRCLSIRPGNQEAGRIWG